MSCTRVTCITMCEVWVFKHFSFANQSGHAPQRGIKCQEKQGSKFSRHHRSLLHHRNCRHHRHQQPLYLLLLVVPTVSLVQAHLYPKQPLAKKCNKFRLIFIIRFGDFWKLWTFNNIGVAFLKIFMPCYSSHFRTPPTTNSLLKYLMICY